MAAGGDAGAKRRAARKAAVEKRPVSAKAAALKARKAGAVAKYKKMLRREGLSSKRFGAKAEAEGGRDAARDEAGAAKRTKRQAKRRAAEAEARAEEAARAEQAAEKEAALRRRRLNASAARKRTAKGQPVMRDRMEDLLRKVRRSVGV